MKFSKTQALVYVVLSLFIIFSIKAFAIPGLYTSHDAETHTARLANYYLALRQGQFPPALAPTLFAGMGYPIFIFIYPLPYLVGTLFHSLGFSFTSSLELTMAFGHLLSGLLFYKFLKLETQKTLPSFLGALFFTWAPYRFLMLFVRGAFAESFSYLFIALSFLCLNRLFHHQNFRWVGFSALSLSGLLLSHQLTAIMFLPLLTYYALIKLTQQKNPRRHLSRLLAALLLGFAIASYIYAPAFLERQHLHFDQALDYTKEHFVTPYQLIRSPWSYGFSMPGSQNDDMSFQIGLTHLSSVGLALAFLASRFSRKHTRSLDSPFLWMSLWLLPFFISSLLMIDHPLNHALWAKLPGLTFIDFPWRLLGVATTSAALVTAYLVIAKPRLLLYLFLFSMVIYANRNHLRINQPLVLDDDHFLNYASTATFKNEFQSKWRQTGKFEGINGQFSLIDSAPLPPHTIHDSRTHRLDLTVDLTEPTTLILHRLYFPGWQIYLDDQLQPLDGGTFSVSGHMDTANDIDYSGLLQLNTPSGTHRIQAVFAPSPVRQWGLYLSLLGLFTTLLLITLPRFSRQPSLISLKPKA